MSIQVGDPIPHATLKRLGEGGLEDVSTADLFQGRKVVLFSVPGAFTPTCSNHHLPGYVEQADAIRSKGVDEIVCLAVNDPFVMHAWERAQGASGKVTMLADGNGELTHKLGLDMDGSGFGLGTRGKRFSMLVDDGIVKTLAVEESPGVSVSGAAACLATLE